MLKVGDIGTGLMGSIKTGQPIQNCHIGSQHGQGKFITRGSLGS